MNDSRIKALKPHVSYRKRVNISTYPLFLTSQFKSNTNTVHISRTLFSHKENEILHTIKWEPTNVPVPVPVTVPVPEPEPVTETVPQEGEHECVIEPDNETETIPQEGEHECIIEPDNEPETIPQEGEHECVIEPENENGKIGFIILRHVNSSKTNQYWKECYRCIKRFYPKNRILIIDDNSNYSFVTNDPLDNTMVIQSEFPTRGEFLPYYYYLKTKFCETAVILHDSVFIKKYIFFNVNTYKILWDFGKECIVDSLSFKHQVSMLGALNSEKLNSFYNKKDLNVWRGCFGCMSVIKYDYLKHIDNEYRLASLIPYITCRDARCAFERIIACLLQINLKEPSLFGSIHSYCRWGLSYDEYIKNKYSNRLPIIKVWTGR